MTTVALDVMGSDHGPPATVGGALLAAADRIEVVLVGDEAAIEPELERWGRARKRPRIVHAPDIVEMDERAAMRVRHQRETSMHVAMDLVKRGEADTMVTLGNTGAAMATALAVFGRIRGVERPALAGLLPAPAGRVLFLDIGANADARPSHLYQFAHMGSAYLQRVHQVERPRVALLSIGEESNKGSHLVLETHAMLAGDAAIEFVGNVESRDLLSGELDVVVTDGFTGNVCLKMAEGMLHMLFGEMRRMVDSSPRMKAGGALLMPGLREMGERLDYRRYGAVPLLGVNGGVFIGHGRSDEQAVASAIRTAQHAADRHMLDALAQAVAAP